MAPHPTEPSLKHKAFGFVGSIFWISMSLLPLPIRWTVGSAIGSILYLLVGSRRRVVHRNLELCFPEKSKAERTQLAKQTFRNAGRGVFSWGFGLFASQRRIDREVEWKGRDSFQSFIKLKRPVILLCPHFTAPMLTYRTVGSVTPAVSIYRRPRNPIFDMGYHCALTGVESPFPWLNKIYQRRGNHYLRMIPSRGSMSPFYKALKSGTPFFYLPDQNGNRPPHITFAPFFGVSASTFTTLTRFSKFADARIFLCHTLMSDTRKCYEMRTELLPENFISGDSQADAERLNQLVESLVRENPDQYFWLHKRFSTRPEGEPSIY